MNLNEFITEVHQNAVDHGWWETDRSISESVVLIHSEWSEAVEEARAGRPMVYRVCTGGLDEIDCDGHPSMELNEVCTQSVYEKCNYRQQKPEGIAVELMDGVIRILDLYGKYGISFTRSTVQQIVRATKQANPLLNKDTPLVEIIAVAHSLTAKAGDSMVRGFDPRIALSALEACAGVVMWWVDTHGEDPEKILREKHEYNLTRPYKHGKKF